MISISNFIDPLDGLAFPKVCQICMEASAYASEGFACANCQTQIYPTTPPWCEQSGLPFDGATGEALTCKNCHEADWKFTHARAMFSARGLIRKVIHRYKYNRHEYFEPLMTSWLIGCEALLDHSPQCVVPVPLYPVKERERGFNQAERLATAISAYLNLPMEKNISRIKYTETQTNLSRTGRMKNMYGSFESNGHIAFLHVLLVDDVMTTGATASACADTLKQAGANEVTVLTLARGKPV